MLRHFVVMKSINRLTFIFLYTLAVTVGFLITFKSGASIFYHKITLNVKHCVLEEGFAYRCPVDLRPILFPPDSVLLFEDTSQLSSDSRHQVGLIGDGRFTAKATKEDGYNLFFAPTGNHNPQNNGKTYRAYFAFRFISRTAGILYLGLLLPGFFGIVRLTLLQVKAHKSLRKLPQEIPQLVYGHIAQQRAYLAGIRSALNSDWHSHFLMWGKLCVVLVLAAYGLVFIEWIFQATGISFLTVLRLGQKLDAFLISGLFLAGLGLVPVTILWVFSLALRLARLAWVPFLIATLAPTATLWLMIVVLVDNFTYVVFKFGIIASAGLPRTIYGILVAVAFVSLYWKLMKSYGSDRREVRFMGDFRWFSWIAIGLAVPSIIVTMSSFTPASSIQVSRGNSGTSTQKQPNILLIGSDGLSARHMSIYGYERDTTPNISALGRTSLVAENTFANADTSLGSVAAIFTSKLPTQTRVLFSPDILQGADSYEHLPGILSASGYKTVEIGVPYYVDAYMMNVQNGFDVSNQRSLQSDPLVSAWREAGYERSAYFLYTLEGKLLDRIQHVFYLNSIANPYSLVALPAEWKGDRERIDQLLALLTQKGRPVFVHVHLMGTHGPEFLVSDPKFSLGQEQTKKWMADFYDDSVLAFDRYIGELVQTLKSNGQYEHTILIIYSDHPMGWNIHERIPLILHFPGDQHAGVITYNTQNLDIAPTLLDYLGKLVPDWMAGRSLLSENPRAGDWIYSATVTDVARNAHILRLGDVARTGFPFYQFDTVQVVACDHWYELDLWSREWASGVVPEHTVSCAESDLPNKEEILQSILSLLESHGFDVSSLR